MPTDLDSLIVYLTAQGLGLGVLTSLALGYLFKQGWAQNSQLRRLLSVVVPFAVPFVLWAGGALLGAWPLDQAGAAHALVIAMSAVGGTKGTYVVGQAVAPTTPPPFVPPPLPPPHG